jgi:hypothetical protein
MVRNLSAGEAVPIVAICGAAFFLVFGIWPFFAPQSFFDNLADYPPYNEHFLHDIGAFQIGLGATLIFALIWRSDALLAALAGGGVGGAFHFWAHLTDHHLGGATYQTAIIGVVATLLSAGAAMQWKGRRVISQTK